MKDLLQVVERIRDINKRFRAMDDPRTQREDELYKLIGELADANADGLSMAFARISILTMELEESKECLDKTQKILSTFQN